MVDEIKISKQPHPHLYCKHSRLLSYLYSRLMERLGIQIIYPGSLLDPTGRETVMYFIYMAERLFLQKRIVIHAETKGISHFSMPIFFQNFHCTVFKFFMSYEPGSSGG